MNPDTHSSCLIEAFAKACEALNHYAQELRRAEAFPQVITGADIRHLATGWCLEKWMEAELNTVEGHWACWWLELGGGGTKWRLSTSISISHAPIWFELDEAEFDSADAVTQALPQVLLKLTDALACHSGFQEAISKMKAA